MKFSVNQVMLNTAIQSQSKIASTKSITKTQNSILFEITNDHLKLSASDGKNTIEKNIMANIFEQGSMLLPYSYLSELIKKMPAADIEFELEKNGNVKISSGKIEYNLLSYQADDFQLLKMETEEEFISLDAELLNKAINQVKYAISKDEKRPILTGILFEFVENQLKLVAIDGYRMAYKIISIDSNLTKNIVIPEKSISEVQRLISSEGVKEIKVSLNEKQVKFEIGETTLISNLLSGEFINYNKIIPNEHSNEAILKTDDLAEAVDRASVILSDDQSKIIKMIVSDDNIKIKAGSATGNAYEEVPIKLEGDDITIGFNPRFILESMKSIDSEDIKIRFTTKVGPCVITPVDNDDYLYLLLPCVLKDDSN